MDAIKYWVYTKRAPCLYKYDLVPPKRVNEVIYSSKLVDSSEVKPTNCLNNKKIKSKLSILNDSNSSDSQQNVFFEKTNKGKINESAFTTFVSDESVLLNSLNIVNSKRPSSDSSLHKSLKQTASSTFDIITSTPIIPNQCLYGPNEIYGNNGVMRVERKTRIKLQVKNSEESTNDDTDENSTFNTDKHYMQEGVFEDEMSDVSGFTANYIRSTKLTSSKRKTNILQRRKISQQLMNTSRKPGNKIRKKNFKWVNQSMDSDVHTHNVVFTSLGLLNSISAQSNMSKMNESINTASGKSGQKEMVNFLNAKDCDENSIINSSSDDSIFRNKSSLNLDERRKRVQRDRFVSKTNSRNVDIAKVKNESCVTLPKNKRCVLGTSNSLGPVSWTVSTNSLSHSKDKGLKRRPSILSGGQNDDFTDSSNCENSLLVKNSSMVPQNWSKSQLSAWFSDSDDDVPNRRRKYFH